MPSTLSLLVSISNISLTILLAISLSSFIFNFNIIDFDSLQEIQPNRIFREKILFAINTVKR